jgi:predicted methyltransferase
LLLLAACGQRDTAQDGTTRAAAGQTDKGTITAPSIYDLAVANNARPESNRVRDADRLPAQVLEFLGIRPGMTVLDMFAGSGYYTEIIAYVVGDRGHVTAHSNEAYVGFVGDVLNDRFGAGQIRNVDVLMAENNELQLPPESLDAVMLVLSFHDLYHADPDNGWERIDAAKFLAELKKGLKAGGIVGIVDHYAEIGAPASSGGDTHRIDPAIVIADMAAAGFELVAQSDILRNPNDDPTKIVFTPELRGKTDRFILCFRKPL